MGVEFTSGDYELVDTGRRDEYGPIYDERGMAIGLSNVNALRILRVLGFARVGVDHAAPNPLGAPEAEQNPFAVDGEDLAGSEPAEQFLGRVLLALAVEPPDHGTATEQRDNVLWAGRRPGYTQEVLLRLEALARHAMTAGVPVNWS